jgi:hypothetical protein
MKAHKLNDRMKLQIKEMTDKILQDDVRFTGFRTFLELSNTFLFLAQTRPGRNIADEAMIKTQQRDVAEMAAEYHSILSSQYDAAQRLNFFQRLVELHRQTEKCLVSVEADFEREEKQDAKEEARVSAIFERRPASPRSSGVAQRAEERSRVPDVAVPEVSPLSPIFDVPSEQEDEEASNIWSPTTPPRQEEPSALPEPSYSPSPPSAPNPMVPTYSPPPAPRRRTRTLARTSTTAATAVDRSPLAPTRLVGVLPMVPLRTRLVGFLRERHNAFVADHLTRSNLESEN